jgi:hypothetical protein
VPTIDLKSQDLTVPPNFRLVELSSCTNELNIFSLFSTLIPRPVSENFKVVFSYLIRLSHLHPDVFLQNL